MDLLNLLALTVAAAQPTDAVLELEDDCQGGRLSACWELIDRGAMAASQAEPDARRADKPLRKWASVACGLGDRHACALAHRAEVTACEDQTWRWCAPTAWTPVEALPDDRVLTPGDLGTFPLGDGWVQLEGGRVWQEHGFRALVEGANRAWYDGTSIWLGVDSRANTPNSPKASQLVRLAPNGLERLSLAAAEGDYVVRRRSMFTRGLVLDIVNPVDRDSARGKRIVVHDLRTQTRREVSAKEQTSLLRTKSAGDFELQHRPAGFQLVEKSTGKSRTVEYDREEGSPRSYLLANGRVLLLGSKQLRSFGLNGDVLAFPVEPDSQLASFADGSFVVGRDTLTVHGPDGSPRQRWVAGEGRSLLVHDLVAHPDGHSVQVDGRVFWFGEARSSSFPEVLRQAQPLQLAAEEGPDRNPTRAECVASTPPDGMKLEPGARWLSSGRFAVRGPRAFASTPVGKFDSPARAAVANCGDPAWTELDRMEVELVDADGRSLAHQLVAVSSPYMQGRTQWARADASGKLVVHQPGQSKVSFAKEALPISPRMVFGTSRAEGALQPAAQPPLSLAGRWENEKGERRYFFGSERMGEWRGYTAGMWFQEEVLATPEGTVRLGGWLDPTTEWSPLDAEDGKTNRRVLVGKFGWRAGDRATVQTTMDEPDAEVWTTHLEVEAQGSLLRLDEEGERGTWPWELPDPSGAHLLEDGAYGGHTADANLPRPLWWESRRDPDELADEFATTRQGMLRWLVQGGMLDGLRLERGVRRELVLHQSQGTIWIDLEYAGTVRCAPDERALCAQVQMVLHPRFVRLDHPRVEATLIVDPSTLHPHRLEEEIGEFRRTTVWHWGT